MKKYENCNKKKSNAKFRHGYSAYELSNAYMESDLESYMDPDELQGWEDYIEKLNKD